MAVKKAEYRGKCQNCPKPIMPLQMIGNFAWGWAHLECIPTAGPKPAGTKPVGNVTTCSCGGDIADVDCDGGYCMSCGKYYQSVM